MRLGRVFNAPADMGRPLPRVEPVNTSFVAAGIQQPPRPVDGTVTGEGGRTVCEASIDGPFTPLSRLFLPLHKQQLLPIPVVSVSVSVSKPEPTRGKALETPTLIFIRTGVAIKLGGWNRRHTLTNFRWGCRAGPGQAVIHHASSSPCSCCPGTV